MTFDRQRLGAALLLAATVLYLIAIAPGFRYRRAARRAAIAVYVLALGVVVAWIVLWLTGWPAD